MVEKYSMLAENMESSVVAKYDSTKQKETTYQSEADLENAFIEQLCRQAYEYLSIKSEADLIANLRKQLEKLNNYTFEDDEWDTFFKECLANPAHTIQYKAFIIQEDYIQLLHKKDGTTQNIYLLDKANIHNNTLQVINQYTTKDGKHENRYDVSVLVNGLPLVHIELKRRGVSIKEAFNQINRYQHESFWSGSGLFEYVQVFVISNGTFTKYYSNTTRDSHIKSNGNLSNKAGKKTSNSFEFTSWWADAENKPIADLMDFAKTFFAKHTILNILTKYCVFTSDKMLLVMRPYQIVATERILNKIKIASNYKEYGSIKGGGYIWHTTGSGKTLSSFKTALLASQMPDIDKVLFVVDRKDLDYQTMKEYDKFQKGAANSNTSTAILKKQLEDDNSHIIITTIQKLTKFVNANKEHPIFNKHLVLIFDECHRSQFGEQHKDIVKAFKKYHLFGFTGTPIFAEDAHKGTKPSIASLKAGKKTKFVLKTTDQAFGNRLHTYTIVDAIADKNVLPFRIDYISTIKEKENIKDDKVRDIDTEKALQSPERIEKVVSYILEHFNDKTKRNEHSYDFSKLTNIKEVATAKKQRAIEEIKAKVRMTGFNSIFAVASIDMAKLYYTEFQRQMAENPTKKLKIATIYSYVPNGDEYSVDTFDDENPESTGELDTNSREFLGKAIEDYNKMFGTSYDTSSEKFQNYYKDLSLRMKNREIDLLIVVNMFLTGFDATTLNTLWVDKNLRRQGLLQAFSRTNRILNSIKSFGQIVCFRNLEKATNESLALFGNKDAGGIVLLKTFNEYFRDGYKDKDGKFIKPYIQLIEELKEQFPCGEVIVGEQKEKDFICQYGTILRVRNILLSFDEFAANEILTERERQGYQSMYIDLYEKLRKIPDGDKQDINDDIVFEMELIKQVDVNIDYILMLIKKYQSGGNKDQEIIINIQKSVDASMELRSKKDLIMTFIASLTPKTDIDKDWKTYINQQKLNELNRIIEEENLNKEETYKFINNIFRDGFVPVSGTAINKILPPVSFFTKTNDRTKKRISVLDKVKAFFERFKDIATGKLVE